MPKFLVQSAILRSEHNPQSCAEGVAKNLARGKVKDVEAVACYCCNKENRVAFLIEGPNEDEVLEVVQEQLDIPVASIMEVAESQVPNIEAAALA